MSCQRYRAAGVTGAAPARDDGESELDAVAHHVRDFIFVVGVEDDKRILHAPVRGVSDMGYTCQTIEADVVAACASRQPFEDLRAQGSVLLELALECRDCLVCPFQKESDLGVACSFIAAFFPRLVAALVDFPQAVAQGFDQRRAPTGIVQKVVLEIGIARHHPDIAQHFIEHARRTAGTALAAQFKERVPGAGSQQAHHDLAIGEGRVVIGYFAQTGRHGGFRRV